MRAVTYRGVGDLFDRELRGTERDDWPAVLCWARFLHAWSELTFQKGHFGTL